MLSVTYYAGVAQLVEQLICNQQVGGSNPSTSSTIKNFIARDMGVFPSGQRGQTVNLLAYAYGGSNPPAPTNRAKIRMKMRIFVVYELVLSIIFRSHKALKSVRNMVRKRIFYQNPF